MQDADEGTSTYAPPAEKAFGTQYTSILRCKNTLWQSKRPPCFSPLGFRVSPLFFRRGLSSCNRNRCTFKSHQLASARDAPTRFGPVALSDHFCSAGMLGRMGSHFFVSSYLLTPHLDAMKRPLGRGTTLPRGLYQPWLLTTYWLGWSSKCGLWKLKKPS